MTQTRYKIDLTCNIFFLSQTRGILRYYYHFNITFCCTDLCKFCTAALLVTEIKIIKYGEYCHRRGMWTDIASLTNYFHSFFKNFSRILCIWFRPEFFYFLFQVSFRTKRAITAPQWRNMQYTSYDSRNNRYFSWSIFKRESSFRFNGGKRDASYVKKDVSSRKIIERSVIQKFSGKNLNQ